MAIDDKTQFPLPEPPPASAEERARALKLAMQAFDRKHRRGSTADSAEEENISQHRQVQTSGGRLIGQEKGISALPTRAQRNSFMRLKSLALAACAAAVMVGLTVYMVRQTPTQPTQTAQHQVVSPESQNTNQIALAQKPQEAKPDAVKDPQLHGTVQNADEASVMGGAPAPVVTESTKEAPLVAAVPLPAAPESAKDAPVIAAAPPPVAAESRKQAPSAPPGRSALAETGRSRTGDVVFGVQGGFRDAPAGRYSEPNADRFAARPENAFKTVKADPVSTFSLDVDTASYSFMRASLAKNRLPPPASVRTEEFINYFPYDYPQPKSAETPFSVNTAVFPSPWNADRKILAIGVKGYDIAQEERPRANLVFLIDTSGSMSGPGRLPLVKQSLELLLGALDATDKIAIVTYAGQAGVALPPTSVSEKSKIMAVIARLQATGATAGFDGLSTAYDLAKQNFDEKGINRIILATDGDFNVGTTGKEDLKTYVSKQRKSGIFLSVLGFGMGNYKDDRMQVLAQNGNGAAAYIDTLSEARKVLVDEATSSIFPIAKDVKIQVEFNPATVAEYRLVGYEKRLLNREDFNNDAIDAGDVGSGHSVTALYEFVPAGGKTTVDDLRYGERKEAMPVPPVAGEGSDEYAFVKMRYKLPKADTSTLMTTPVPVKSAYATFADAPQEARFAVAVASFAELLRDGRYTGAITFDDVLRIAQAARGPDPYGYRAEFVRLVRAAKTAK